MRVDYAADSVFQEGGVEVDQQAELEVAGSQVRKKLRAMYREQHFNCLQLDDQNSLDQEVDPTLADSYAPVLDVDPDLSLERDASHLELDAQRALVHGLEQPGAKKAMDFDRGANDFLGEYVVFRRKDFRHAGIGIMMVRLLVSRR